MYLERGGMRGNIGRSRVGDKIGFSIMGKENILCFFGPFTIFQPILGKIHEDLGSNFIL
jgi:hypothetical protein